MITDSNELSIYFLYSKSSISKDMTKPFFLKEEKRFASRHFSEMCVSSSVQVHSM